MEKMEKLVNDWIESCKHDIESEEYEKLSWAPDHLYELVTKDYKQLLQVMTSILEKDHSETVVGALGAGVLEDLIFEKGEDSIDAIQQLVDTNPLFKRCIRYTFISENEVSTAVFEKFKTMKK